MSSRYRKYRLMALFCVIGFTLCLWLGQLSSTNLQVQIGEVATAQNSNPSQLVQQGIDSYRLGNFQQAIKDWEKVLGIYQKNQNRSSEAIVRENLARAYPQIGQTEEAIKNWEQVISFYEKLKSTQQKEEKIKTEQKIARAKTELAQVYSSIGQSKKAIVLLCSRQENDNDEECTKNSVLQFTRDIKDTNLEVAVLGSLGNAYRLTGKNDYQKAISYLKFALNKVKEQNNSAYITSLHNSLGNAYSQIALLNYRRALSPVGSSNDTEKFQKTANEDIKKAQINLQESLTIAQRQSDKQAEIQAIESLVRLSINLEEVQTILDKNNPPPKIISSQEVTNLLDKATHLLKDLPQNRERVYTTINLINLRKPTARECITSEFFNQAEKLLDEAIKIAQTLKDARAESFALGEKGHIYECRQEYENAIAFTEKARKAAETGKSPDSLYLWEWQTGRIFRKQEKTTEAIKAYEKAINTLEGSTRSDILTANRDIQFDFRDTVEPIYRDLVAMKLSLETSVETSGKSVTPKDNQNNFSSILKTIDSLKLAELQNYFGDDCNFPAFNQSRDNLHDIKPEFFLKKLIELRKIPTETAFINTLILEDRIAVVLTTYDGKKIQNKLHLSAIKSAQIIQKIDKFRNALGRHQDTIDDYKKHDISLSQEIYNEIIAPFTQDLNPDVIKTLVFIQDGIFRSVPMAALHDGDKFLIQKYAIATIPSLTLTQAEVINPHKLRVLALGLSQKAIVDEQPFKELEYVDKEIKDITKQIPGSLLLRNEDFTRKRIEKELSKQVYPIIHIATHGQFGIRPEDTFIVTGGKNDKNKNEKLTFKDLDILIRRFARNTEPLELLTLTACETAVGDNRSALGLGGVAVQAGAKSALASLWTISDTATAPIAAGFYSNLRNEPKISKAKALQLVQKKIIEDKEIAYKYKHPYYWSAIVLIGNWL